MRPRARRRQATKHDQGDLLRWSNFRVQSGQQPFGQGGGGLKSGHALVAVGLRSKEGRTFAILQCASLEDHGCRRLEVLVDAVQFLTDLVRHQGTAGPITHVGRQA